ncbi:hypothetical protein F4604DRAFT_1821505, partial [Suillus subluteus]
MFISWLRYIVKTAAFRSYRSFLSVLLRLIRHCQSIVNGRKIFENGLAWPLLEAHLQSLHSRGSSLKWTSRIFRCQLPGFMEGSDDAAFNTRLSQKLFCAIEAKLCVRTQHPRSRYRHSTATFKRYHRNVRVKDEYEAFLVEKGPLD